MHDLRFYRAIREVRTRDLADLTGGQLIGDGNKLIVTVAPPDVAERGALCFLDQPPSEGSTLSSTASVCLVNQKLLGLLPDEVIKIVVDRPRASFIQAAGYLLEQRETGVSYPELGPAQIAEGAVVHSSAVISDGVEIGEGSHIAMNVVIGPGVRIGRNCRIGPGVVIEAALVGNGVKIKANSVLGGTGFGLIPTPSGLSQVPHFGRVIIQDNVGLGSCVCVDRGAFNDTVVGEGTYVDNHVHIGHNTQIGRNCVIAAFGGLSGSVVVGDGVQMGGRVGIADHVTVGAGCKLAADSAIMRDVPAGETWGGSPAKPLRQWMKETAWLSRTVKARTNKTDSNNG